MAELERWLIAGLGNPGPQYAGNRHNIGFMVADALCASDDSLGWKASSRFEAEIAIGTLSRRPVVLVKPQTYMNLSGRSVGPLAHFYRVPAERVIVIHDEVDLPLGRMKIKQGGGDAGHNGLRSVTEGVGSDYVRVRVGVGRPQYGEVADYVLKDFRGEEHELRDKEIARAAKAARLVMTRGVKEAANRFNRAPKPPKEPKASDGNGNGSGSGNGNGNGNGNGTSAAT